MSYMDEAKEVVESWRHGLTVLDELERLIAAALQATEQRVWEEASIKIADKAKFYENSTDPHDRIAPMLFAISRGFKAHAARQGEETP